MITKCCTQVLEVLDPSHIAKPLLIVMEIRLSGHKTLSHSMNSLTTVGINWIILTEYRITLRVTQQELSSTLSSFKCTDWSLTATAGLPRAMEIGIASGLVTEFLAESLH